MGRIDTRPQNDAATRVGLRNVHRDTRGNVIGAVTAEGRPLGTMGNPNRAGTSSGFKTAAAAAPSQSAQPVATPGWRGSATPRLDAGPQTPGLDAQAPPVASNLARRQSLFADMQKAGAGGLTPEMSQRAKQLGVDGAGWRRGVAKLTAAPAAPAAFAPAAAPVAIPPPTSITHTAASVPATAVATRSPMVEKAIALRDIGKLAASYTPSTPAAPVAQAPRFAVPPVANPQAVATHAAPASAFQALTTPRAAAVAPVAAPKPVAVATSPASTPAWRKPLVGGPSFTTAEAKSQARENQVATQRMVKRTAYNAAWNSQPDLPVVDKNSVANKVQKSVMTFLSGRSY